MSEVGRPSELNDELCLKIREWVLDNKTLEEIAELSGISMKTIQCWITRNYEGFADKWRTYRIERRLAKSEVNIDKFLDLEPVDIVTVTRVIEGEDGKDIIETKTTKTIDYRAMKIVADLSTFVAESVGKKDYSKRTELTGDKGGPVQVTNITDDEFRKIVENYGTNNRAKSSGAEENLQ